MALVLFLLSISKEYFELPLIICTVFFLIFFACEGIWFQIAAARRENELCRYQRVEHPRRVTGDSYIDLFS